MTPTGGASTAFYVDALKHLSRSGIPFLVGGAYALGHYTGIARATKDLDVFLRKAHVDPVLALFERVGYRAELSFPHWLAKVHCGDQYVDLIFSSGNGVATVDDAWFDNAVFANVLGLPVRLCPPEETIWSKAFVQERERFDGADVLHLMHRLGSSLDWNRLVKRFGPHWRVLFAHIVMFGFVYPGRRANIPGWVTEALTSRFLGDNLEGEAVNDDVCNGTLLSREQYAYDVNDLAYDDPRVEPRGSMSPEDVDVWTAAIEEDK